MKAKLANLLAELQREAALYRENQAATHLRPERARLLLHEAAKQGQDSVRIRLPEGVNVRGCDSTELFEMWVRENGLTIVWERRMCDMPDGRRVEIEEPEISWHAKS